MYKYKGARAVEATVKTMLSESADTNAFLVDVC